MKQVFWQSDWLTTTIVALFNLFCKTFTLVMLILVRITQSNHYGFLAGFELTNPFLYFKKSHQLP